MKRLLAVLTVALCCASARAQLATAIYANSATGTTQNTLTKIVNVSGSPVAQIMATTDTSGAIGITTSPTATSGQATITYAGLAPCIFDNTTVANDYVQISSTVAGNCHDAGSTRPTSGQIIGVVGQTGGSAGTYLVLLDKSILPSSSGTPVPVCSATGSSDTLSAAGTFATTCSVPSTAISGAGQTLHIIAHGVYSGGATAPTINLQVNAGGTTGLCQTLGSGSSMSGATSASNLGWDVVCNVQIVTTGAPGTAYASGSEDAANSAGGGVTSRLLCNANPCTAATSSFTTSSTQTVSIQEIGAFVASQSMTLNSLVVTNY